MLKPWLSRILQVVGALALVALAVIVYRRTDWSKGLTPDGVMTLIAGVIAFIAVIIQIRFSSRQVREQLTAQRDAERVEQERQKRAIASAILYEIDSFDMLELGQVEKTLSTWDPESGPLPSAGGWRQNSLELYKANSYKLGFLNLKSVSAIVKFYAMAGIYEGLFRDYQRFLELGIAGASQVQVDKYCREQLKKIRDLLPSLRKLATTVCTSVAQDCGLDELVAKKDAQTN